MTTLHFSLFGTLQLIDAPPDHALPTSRNGRLLLAYLLLNLDRTHTRSKLADLISPQNTEERARRHLSQALWEVRRHLPQIDIDSHGDQLMLKGEQIETDVKRFSIWQQQAQNNDLTTAENALDCYTADLLTDIDASWILPLRQHRRNQYLYLLRQTINRAKQWGQLGRALNHALRLSHYEPFDEINQREVIRLYISLNQPRAAIQYYEQVRACFLAELNTEPDAETRRLVREILFQHKTLETPYVPITSPAYALHAPDQIPLVGRAAERQQINHYLQSASVQGEGTICLIKGDSGVGKSRFLAEIQRDAEWRHISVLNTCGDSGHGYSPFRALVKALTPALTPLKIQQLDSLLSQPAIQALHLLFPQLRPKLVTKSEKTADSENKLFSALTELLTVWASQRPQLLVFDDTQWLDFATLNFLSYLAKTIHEQPIVCLLAYRTAELEIDPIRRQVVEQIMMSNTSWGNIELWPLDTIEVEELIQKGLGIQYEIPQFTHRLRQESGGLPLLVLEILRLLHETGQIIRQSDGSWETPLSAEQDNYGEIHDLLKMTNPFVQRLNTLKPIGRRLLETAAVLGSQFDFAHSSQLAALTPEQTLTQLNIGIQRGLLQEEDSHYRFTHDKIRETLLDFISSDDRVQIHCQIVALFQQDPSVLPERLAYHAHQGEMWLAAAQYYLQAGEHAYNLHASTNALQCYEMVFTLLDSYPQAFSKKEASQLRYQGLSKRQGHLREAGDIPKQRAELAELKQLPMLTNQQQVNLLNHEAYFLLDAEQNPKEAQIRAEQAQQIAKKIRYLHGEAQAFSHLSKIFVRSSQFDEAKATADKAYALIQKTTNNKRQTFAIIHSLVHINSTLGRPEENQPLFIQLQAIAEELEDYYLLSSLYHSRSLDFFEAGKFAEGLEVAQKALGIFEKLGQIRNCATVLINIGLMLWGLDDIGKAYDSINGGIEFYKQAHYQNGVLTGYSNLATLCLDMGQLSLAKVHIETGLNLAKSLDHAHMQVSLGLDQVRYFLYTENLAKAQTLMNDLFELVKQVDLPYLQADLLLTQGHVYTALSDWLMAERCYIEATAKITAAQRMWGIAICKTHQAYATFRAGHNQKAIELIEEAYQFQLEYSNDNALYLYWYYTQIKPPAPPFNALTEAYALMTKRRDSLPDAWKKEFGDFPLHKQIQDAWNANQPESIAYQLPLLTAPRRGKIQPHHMRTVTLTPNHPADQEIRNKKARRWQQIGRLQTEAIDQNCHIRLDDLAALLQTSITTIKRDLQQMKRRK